MTPESTISLEGIAMIFGGILALWSVLSAILQVYREVHDTRVLVNVVCRHLGIDPEEIVGKK